MSVVPRSRAHACVRACVSAGGAAAGRRAERVGGLPPGQAVLSFPSSSPILPVSAKEFAVQGQVSGESVLSTGGVRSIRRGREACS